MSDEKNKEPEVVETKADEVVVEEKKTIDWKGVGKKALGIGKVALVAAAAFIAGGAVAASKSIEENKKEDVIEDENSTYEE